MPETVFTILKKDHELVKQLKEQKLKPENTVMVMA